MFQVGLQGFHVGGHDDANGLWADGALLPSMSESRGGLSFRQAVIGALVLFIFFFVLFFGASARQRVTIDTRPVLDSPGKRKGGDLDDRKKKEENLKRDPRKSNSKRSSAKEDESSTTLLDQDYSENLFLRQC